MQATSPAYFKLLLGHRRIQALLGGLFLVLTIFSLRRYASSKSAAVASTPAEWLTVPQHSLNDLDDTKLHFLLPATERNAHLCKLILSSTINGYPAPVIINWEKNFHDDTISYNGSHIGKITGILSYLDATKPEHDDELVLVADAYDIWFQLPFEVFKSRFHAINKYLVSVTEKAIGASTMTAAGIRQGVIFPAQRDCTPRHSDILEISCFAQPESPLPRDIYGPETDMLDEKTHLPLKMRPHWLNSGMTTGSVREMRLLFQRALEKSQTVNHKGSDQYIFNEIFGEQQYNRELARKEQRGILQRAADGLAWVLGSYKPSIVDTYPTKRFDQSSTGSGVQYEFGIGLDYWLQLAHTAVLAEFDGQWLTFDTVESAVRQQKDFGHTPASIEDLPPDIADAALPFRNMTEVPLVALTKWQDVPLYTNLFTGTIPIAIHMNGMKVMRENLWDRLWFHEHMRPMLDAYAKTAKVGAWSDKHEWLPWEELCDGFEDEIFRDDLGPWKHPED